MIMGMGFNPRTPRGVRPSYSKIKSLDIKSFNPRTPRGVRRFGISEPIRIFDVSIHAPHAGCDVDRAGKDFRVFGFNPRTPRGVRPSLPSIPVRGLMFQSTHPTRGATRSICYDSWHKRVSIHAPHAGCD